MGIPKIIHYCWFGNNEKPDKVIRCIESWKKYCPEYEIIEWNESNYNYNSHPYVEAAYKEKKWAFVSDYARLDIIYNYGGFYFDTDVELIHSLDDILDNDCILGIEKGTCKVNTGQGIGATKKNEMVKMLMKQYDGVSFYKESGQLNLTPCTYYTTIYLEKLGYKAKDQTQKIKDTIIFASEYFCPMQYETRKMKVTGNTLSIHWYDASWLSKEEIGFISFQAKISRFMPLKLARVVTNIYAYSYRIVQYTREGKLLKVIKERLFCKHRGRK